MNARSEDGSTALLWAAHWNDVATAGLLIRAGANANTANDFGMTPLSRACTNGSALLVDLLLKAGANPNTPIATGETPIMTCAGSGNADAVRMLIARGADVNAKEPSQHQNALMWAAAERHANVVRLLDRSGGRSSGAHEEGIHRAALRGARRRSRQHDGVAGRRREREHPIAARRDVETERAVETRRPVDAARPAPRRSAWHHEVRPIRRRSLRAARRCSWPRVRGHVPLALFLLEQGADPNVLDAGFTPLHWASGTWEGGISNPVYGFTDAMSGIPNRQAKLQLVKALLAHGANPNARMTRRPPGFAGLGGGYEDAAGATPFLLASAAADLEMMRLLLAAGADPATGHRHEDHAGDGGVRPQSRDRRKPDHRGAGARRGEVPVRPGRRRDAARPPTARTRCSARRTAAGTRCWRCSSRRAPT